MSSNQFNKLNAGTVLLWGYKEHYAFKKFAGRKREERERKRSLQAGRDKHYDRGVQGAKRVLARPEARARRWRGS